MNAIIIEDEKPASQKLQKALLKCNDPITVVATLDSAKESIAWLQTQATPDLIFMDIELGDGTAFNILEQVSIACPVIFTTAYDEYWQEAFENNGIDYLLKPIKKGKLEISLKKYYLLREHFAGNLQKLLQSQESK